MSTHNMCFHGEIRKHFPDTYSNLELCVSSRSKLQIYKRDILKKNTILFSMKTDVAGTH